MEHKKAILFLKFDDKWYLSKVWNHWHGICSCISSVSKCLYEACDTCLKEGFDGSYKSEDTYIDNIKFREV